MANYLTGFRCIKCSGQFNADYSGYLCDSCGSNLDAVYDYEGISSEISIAALKADTRRDVWRYSPFFPLNGLDHIPPLDMSLTPLYRCTSIERDAGLDEVYLKDDTRFPSGSFKDRASSVVMAVAREKGIDSVACASTGNAGCSWACMGAACGINVRIYLPQTAPMAKIAQLKVYGANIRIIDGTYDDAYDCCVDDCESSGLFNRCTGYNPYTREGKKSVSFEIWEQLGYRAPGSVFVPVGDGNILSGVWKGFSDLKACGLIGEIPRIFSVQSEKSDAVSRTFEKMVAEGIDNVDDVVTVTSNTRADSIAVDKPRDGLAAAKAVLETGGAVVRVSDSSIVRNIFYIAAATGIFSEPAGAASVAGLREAAAGSQNGNIKSPVVCLITGTGLKDIDAVLERGKNE